MQRIPFDFRVGLDHRAGLDGLSRPNHGYGEAFRRLQAGPMEGFRYFPSNPGILDGNPDHSILCQFCFEPQPIRESQLFRLMKLLTLQLQAYRARVNDFEKMINTKDITMLTGPTHSDFPVGIKAVARMGIASKGGPKVLFPEELSDVLPRLTDSQKANILDGLKKRLQQLELIMQKARTLVSTPQLAFEHIIKSSRKVESSTTQLPVLIDINVENVLGKPFTEWARINWPRDDYKQAVPRDFSLFTSLNDEVAAHVLLSAEYNRIMHSRSQLGQPVLKPGASTLKGDIHPIFAASNWHLTSPEQYNVLKPALRLATLMLTHPAASAYWHTRAFGLREKWTTPRGKSAMRIRHDVPFTQKNADRFLKHLMDISEHVKFHFGAWNPAVDKCYAFMWVPCNHRSMYSLPFDDTDVRYCKIGFSFDFYIVLERLLHTKRPDPDMLMRFNFLFAVMVCHEVAHFLEVGHQQVVTEEGYMYDHDWTESGAAFEVRTFGSKIYSIADRLDGAYGLCLSDWPRIDPRSFYSMPMDYVVWIQQQKTWDNPSLKANQFVIPRNGVVAHIHPITAKQAEDKSQDGVGSLRTAMERLSLR